MFQQCYNHNLGMFIACYHNNEDGPEENMHTETKPKLQVKGRVGERILFSDY